MKKLGIWMASKQGPCRRDLDYLLRPTVRSQDGAMAQTLPENRRIHTGRGYTCSLDPSILHCVPGTPITDHSTPLLYFCHISYPLCLGSSSCFFYTFSSLCLLNNCCFFCQISPLLSSPLFCRWWNCLSPYITWNMSWWLRTCEELGIISSRPYITFSSLLCYDALMLQV